MTDLIDVLEISELSTYTDYTEILTDNFNIIIEQLQNIYNVNLLILSFGISLIILLIIYSVLKKFFY